MAASPNNSLCAVGIAYNAQIGGIRMLDGQGKNFMLLKKGEFVFFFKFIEEKKYLASATIHVEIYQLTAGSWLFITINGTLVFNPKKISSKFTKSVTFRL